MKPAGRPDALLVDFGGVLYTTRRRPAWREVIADEIERLLGRAGCDAPDREVILRDLEVARIAEAAWKTAASRTVAPTELAGVTFWGEFVASDWSATARASLTAAAPVLSRLLVDSVAECIPREGARELLEEAARRQIPVAVVSNARAGAAFRAHLAQDGFEEHIALQVYSDEVGIRKPNPEMLALAARGLGVRPERCWYGGDHYDRDVICARRAGIGLAVLIHDKKTTSPAYPAQAEADIELRSPRELAGLLVAQDGQPSMSATPNGVRARRRPPRTARRSRPAALLMDHGGVVVTSRPNEAGRRAFARAVVRYLERTGWRGFDADSVAADIEHAHDLHGERKASNGPSIPEVSHLEFWRDLVAGNWSDHPRAAVAARASRLMFDHITTRSERTRRPGILELMAACRAARVPIGIVSNTLCGAVIRDLSTKLGTAEFIGVEIYSDEFGFRKPDPTTIEAAARALGVDPSDCWYVGDKPHRDLRCARAAGVGCAVLVRRSTDIGTHLDADLVVDAPGELLAHLEAARS